MIDCVLIGRSGCFAYLLLCLYVVTVVVFLLSLYETLFGQYLGLIVMTCCYSFWWMADMFEFGLISVLWIIACLIFLGLLLWFWSGLGDKMPWMAMGQGLSYVLISNNLLHKKHSILFGKTILSISVIVTLCTRFVVNLLQTDFYVLSDFMSILST